ncbi:MAG TPA: hypothetical protein VJN50_09605 [Actinomycetota bacterium]|nr:hypothetical protein [Actinomycetota bacterium]
MKRPVLCCLEILAFGVALVVGGATAVFAQLPIDPTATPVKNTGGWVYNMAQLMTVLGVLFLVLIVLGYMRFAPRFQRDESLRTVRAEPIKPGREPPRRAVDVSQAMPVVVAPPVVPAAAPAAPAPAVPAPVAKPPAPALAPVAEPPTPAAPVPEPAAAPVPAAPAPTPSHAAAPAPGEHKEVSLDQETFDRVLAELLEKGTDRRVAEGQARRAAMIAARKKAGG